MAFVPPRMQSKFASLSGVLRAALVKRGFNSAALFRGMFDGTLEDALEVVREYGGIDGDANYLVELWVGLEPTAQSELRRIAHTSPSAAAAAVLQAERKRALVTPLMGCNTFFFVSESFFCRVK